MKIAVTVSDANAAVHVGGCVSRRTAIIEILDKKIPSIVHEYFTEKQRARENKNCSCFMDIEFSLVDERIKEAEGSEG